MRKQKNTISLAVVLVPCIPQKNSEVSVFSISDEIHEFPDNGFSKSTTLEIIDGPLAPAPTTYCVATNPSDDACYYMLLQEVLSVTLLKEHILSLCITPFTSLQ